MDEYNKKIDIIYRFLSVKGIGTVQGNKFLIKSQDINNTQQLEQEIPTFLNETQFKEYKETSSVTATLNSKFPVNFICLTDSNYPYAIKDCLEMNSPTVLSYIGNLELLKLKKIAFSGSRKVSDKGIEIAKDCVEQIVLENGVIVSGYAKGVDFVAHYTALENEGKTIIILPEGINFFTIKSELKSIWDWDRVLVISEFKPTEKWMASRAMKRNDTIIGMSDIIVVIEAGNTGGSLDAGEKTLNYGKPLFVPQYSVIPESAFGNEILLRKGAFPIKMSKETAKPNLAKMFSFFNSQGTFSLF